MNVTDACERQPSTLMNLAQIHTIDMIRAAPKEYCRAPFTLPFQSTQQKSVSSDLLSEQHATRLPLNGKHNSNSNTLMGSVKTEFQ